uniref:Uncharacterized protein n=1 Tax=Ananas comosus var. bracteatus TaxID=296719 RepID=A0A6V7P6B2_ANACO|nr:unnamed protein product [Ananas comosus var. bracteatus]
MANEGLGDEAPRILGDMTNIFGKRPLSLDLKISTNENKVDRYKESPPKRQKGTGYETRCYRKNKCAIDDKENRRGSAKETCHSTASDYRDYLNKENTRTTDHPFSLCSDNIDSDSNTCGNIEVKMPKHDCELLGSLSGRSSKARESQQEQEERREEGYETDGEETSRNAARNDGEFLNSVSEMEDKINVGNDEAKDPVGKSGSLELFDTSGSSGYRMNDAKEILNLHHAQNSEDAKGKGSVHLDKASAHMLADLHYQDASGRLSAVNRTRKQIRLLEGKNYGLAQTGKTPRDIPKQSVEMELELTQHWKSLFLHTDNVLERETTQLHSTLLRLKELKENCKRDLEISTVSLDD